jgi:uncharacterized protein (DUF58 family)
MAAPAQARRAVGVLLAGAGLILVSLAFDSSSLFVPGIAFVLLGVGSWAWVAVVSKGASVDRVLHSDRVIEGDPFEATVEVRGGPLGVAGAEIQDPLAGAPLLLRGGGRAATVRVVARFDRRGLRIVPPPSLVVRDPLMLAQRHGLCLTSVQQVLVLPRTERVSWRNGGGAERFSSPGALSRAHVTIAVEFDGLRPYQPGTPASRIHWPAFARGAGLLERRLRGDDDFRPLVILDVRGELALERIDAAVRAAASLTLELARTGGCLLLVPGERRATAVEPDLASWPSVHARLALVEGGPDAPAPTLMAARSRLGPVLYVTAAPLERPPAVLGGGSVVLVMPVGPAPRGVRASFDVSGCQGFAVGSRSRIRELAV